jgi:hypothetical protein
MGGGNDSGAGQDPQRTGMELFDKLDDLKSMHSLADLTTLISNSPSDYSYFNFDKIKLTDLPKHLKRIATQMTAANNALNGDDQQAPQTARLTATAKNRKEVPRVEFKQTVDLMKFFKITKKAIYLCDKTIEKRSEKPLRLETERSFDFNARELFQPFEKAIAVSKFVDRFFKEYFLNLKSFTNKGQNPHR